MNVPENKALDHWLWRRGRGWLRVCKNDALIALHRLCLKQWGNHSRRGFDAETVQKSFEHYRNVLEQYDYVWLSHLIRIERVGYRASSYYHKENTRQSSRSN